MMSTVLQACAVAAVVLVGASKTVRNEIRNNALFLPVDTASADAKISVKVKTNGQDSAGAAGGDRSSLPASFGKLPRFALRQFTPPVTVYNNPNPRLPMEPTLPGDPSTPVPAIDYPLYGNPLSKYLTPSNGTGSGGGVGDLKSSSPSANTGDNPAHGSGGDVGAGAFRIGDGITPPALVSKVDPEYSEEGRQGHREGIVVVGARIDAAGRVIDLHVIRGLGFGLDEEALAAVKQWIFLPAEKDGKPVTVEIQVQVTFRLA